ncbi:hypothetical protein, variant [Thecamonas trahens ATCC 50062]|nr:hypothetical protein, variant [Thecamonas trahens ATCC 50062]KNC49798.1 hypothetical protein, variant [Thecamonas trahens ATCC 50062]|eukprot:XP_013757582.1 hypothetical protein, variant [Thecamonas trahens ATCC 50062]
MVAVASDGGSSGGGSGSGMARASSSEAISEADGAGDELVSAPGLSSNVRRRLIGRRDSSPPVMGAGGDAPLLHEIDFQSDIDVVRSGWLAKKKSSGGMLRNWDKRFFLLKSGVLYYAKSDKARVPVGSIQLDGRVVVRGKGKSRDIVLTHAQKRTYILRADSVAEAIQWINDIHAHSAAQSKGESLLNSSSPNLTRRVDSEGSVGQGLSHSSSTPTLAELAMPPSVVRMISQGKLPEDIGVYIRDGSVKIAEGRSGGSGKSRHMFLFSNALVYASPTGKKDYKVRGMLDLSGVSVCDIPAVETHTFHFCIICDKGRFIVETETLDAKIEWMTDIFEASEILNNGFLALDDEAGPVNVLNASLSPAVAVPRPSLPSPLPSRPSPLARQATGGSSSQPSSPASASPPPRKAQPDSTPTSSPTPSPKSSKKAERELRKERMMSMRSMVCLDKSFPKPPMPNCVRLGTYNVQPDPTAKSSLASKWSERRALFATSVRFHSPDVLAMQNISLAKASELLGKMSDYAMMDGASEHFEAEGVDRAAVPGSNTRPFLPIFYFRWRLQLADSGNYFLSPKPSAKLDADLPIDQDVLLLRNAAIASENLPSRSPTAPYVWVTWGLFQDVFTEAAFYVFTCDLTPACETPESRAAHVAALHRTIGARVGNTPFVLALSGFLTPPPAEPLLDGMLAPFGDGGSIALHSMAELDVPPSHEHVGAEATFTAPTGETMVLDHILYRSGAVEVLLSGVTEDVFISGARPALHSLVLADLIIDMSGAE